MYSKVQDQVRDQWLGLELNTLMNTQTQVIEHIAILQFCLQLLKIWEVFEHVWGKHAISGFLSDECKIQNGVIAIIITNRNNLVGLVDKVLPTWLG